MFPFTINVPVELADWNLPCVTITFPSTLKVPVVNALKIPAPPVAPAAVIIKSPLITAVVDVVKKLIVAVAAGQLYMKFPKD